MAFVASRKFVAWSVKVEAAKAAMNVSLICVVLQLGGMICWQYVICWLTIGQIQRTKWQIPPGNPEVLQEGLARIVRCECPKGWPKATEWHCCAVECSITGCLKRHPGTCPPSPAETTEPDFFFVYVKCCSAHAQCVCALCLRMEMASAHFLLALRGLCLIWHCAFTALNLARVGSTVS